jgi:sugar lactone lactonase YvrE
MALAGLVAPSPAQAGSPGPPIPAPKRPDYIGALPVTIVAEHLDGTPFQIPQGVFYDASHDEVFVADTGNALIGVFDGDGVPKFTFALGESASYPTSIFTDADGNIYVLRPGSASVAVFSYRGEPLRTVGPGEIVEGTKPVLSGMGLGPDGRMYLLDGAAGRILVCNLDGTLVRTIRGSGRGGLRLQAPYDIAFDPEGNLYVSDARGMPVQIYDPSGKFLRGFGKHEMGAENFAIPAGIAVAPDGRILVADPIRQDVKIYDPDGAYYDRLGGAFGQAPWEMAYPTDVAAGKGGRVYVVERVGRRLQILDRIPLTDAPDRTRPQLRTPAAKKSTP